MYAVRGLKLGAILEKTQSLELEKQNQNLFSKPVENWFHLNSS